MNGVRLDPATRIAGLYVVVAALCLVLCDCLISQFAAENLEFIRFELIKGLVFVVITAGLIYVERRRADRESRYLASIVDSAQAAIIGANVAGIITSWNRGAEDLYGYSPGEIVGRPVTVLIPADRPQDAGFILGRIRQGVAIRGYETVRLRKDGTRVPISLIVSPIRNAGGAVIGLSSIAQDISEQKRAEKACQMAEVGQLASGLVHEIRNPLNAMRMQIAVIQDSLETAERDDIDLARSQLKCLEGEVLRVQKLASSFLAYGRPARNKPVRIELPDVLRDVVEFIRPEFTNIQATVRLDIQQGAGELAVLMDRDQLRQALINIAENARQAIATGGSLAICCDRPNDGHVRLRFRDDGCGIPPDILPHIFKAFFSTKEEGTGLGLAIVANTVETAGGTVCAASEVDQGTCIEIVLPSARQEGDARAAAERSLDGSKP